MIAEAPLDEIEIRPLPTSRRFDVNAAVLAAIAAVPDDGKNTHFVAHADYHGGEGEVSMAVMVRAGDSWSFAGYLDQRFHGPFRPLPNGLTIGAEVRFSR